MAARSSSTTRITPPSRRTQIVWGAFFAAMTVVVGLLALNDDRRLGGFVATEISRLGDDSAVEPVFSTAAPLDHKRWRGIVIHHLGAPAGDPESIHRQHLGHGWDGLGYHFLIGNGNGLDDGVIHVGYRWDRQLPGVHATGPFADELNRHAIGICLIGNGDNHAFTNRQITHLTALVQRLQEALDIPAGQVFLHRQVATGQTSPGQHFPAARFTASLLDTTR
ncbi:MAG: peptidoglycan recognition protein family protein [Planctomycetota bacterium]